MTDYQTSEGKLFKEVLGNKWKDLHIDIQTRFDKNPSPDSPLKYEGIIDELYCSGWGKVLAYITKPMIKGALIPYSENDVPVDIRVYTLNNDPNIYKERIYKLKNKKPLLFTSNMRLSTNGEVLEYVGMGLGMKLTITEKDSNLHFESDGYFLDIGFFRIPIPALFTPGKTLLG